MERPIADGRAPDPLASFFNEFRGLGRGAFVERYGDALLCLDASELHATPCDDTGPALMAPAAGDVCDDGRGGTGLYALPIRGRNSRHAVLGRARDSDVVLYDRSISSCHAVFELKGSSLWLSDCGSTNGTFVDDLRVGTAQEGGGVEIIGPRCPVRFGSLRAVVLRTTGLVELARMFGLVLDRH